MPQAQLPVFPAGVTHITKELAVETRDGRVTYFNGSMPLFMHDEGDVKTFRMITSQFCINGNAKQADIVRAFGVTGISVKRSVALYRQAGPSGFYEPRKTRGGAVLTVPVLAEAQALLSSGQSIAEVGKTLQIKANTVDKAVQDGRLTAPKRTDQKKAPSKAVARERAA